MKQISEIGVEKIAVHSAVQIDVAHLSLPLTRNITSIICCKAVETAGGGFLLQNSS